MDRIKLIHMDTLSCEPILRRMPNGDLLCVCQCGDVTEPAPGNRVYVFRSSDDGETWSAPSSIYPEDGNAVYMTEVMVLDGVVSAFLTIHSGKFLDWKCVVMESRDNGYHWVNRGAPPFFDSFAFIRGMIRLANGNNADGNNANGNNADGNVVIPYQYYPISAEENARLKSQPTPRGVWDADVKYVQSGVLISRDGGKSYELGGYVRTALKQPGAPGWAWTEPTVAQLSDGKLAMLMRICGTGQLWRSDSSDGGLSWSEAAPTGIPNPSNKPKLIKLDAKRIALIHTPNPKVGFGNRNPLEIWISGDDMKSWSRKLRVTDFPGVYCYPDGIAENNGNRILFTIEYNRHDILFIDRTV